MSSGTESHEKYPLAQSEEEMQRLALQADVLHTEATRWLFERAGLRGGMRVLDVGCGAGDVAMLAAELVGQNGSVVGIDSSATAIDTARLRADRAGLANVSFIQADVADYVHLDEVDAIVGRSVLMYLRDPVSVVRSLLRPLRPGGIVAFREVIIAEPWLEAAPRSQLVDELNTWIMAYAVPAIQDMGVDVRLGLHIHQVFRDAGLATPEMWLHAPIGCEAGWRGWEYVGYQIRAASSLVARAGVRLPAELDPDTLGSRIRDEVLQQGGVLRIQRGVQAWTRKL
ncbi:MAG TPA: class I SAM-dependent methyltransferase [Chloroflexota bacterium]